MAKATLLRDKPREQGKLWASDLGKKCLRQAHYKFNLPGVGAPLLGHTKFKFLYGNLLEEAVLYLAEEAGHDVAFQQHRVETTVDDWKISGRIDGLIDGVLMDVKSTSSYGFSRYKHGITAENDSFGYLQQLAFYKNYGLYENEAGVVTPTEAGFVWIDKQNGHIKYTSCAVEDKSSLEQRARNIISAIEEPDEAMVPRGYSPEPYGKSGNECLPIGCAYCDFKKHCHRDSNGGRGLRTFAYNHKPVDFTTITREPKVQEITK